VSAVVAITIITTIITTAAARLVLIDLRVVLATALVLQRAPLLFLAHELLRQSVIGILVTFRTISTYYRFSSQIAPIAG
jgi:hypothetical protein